ncbi:MAG: glycine--tRNA ligase subunit beta [Candidatus Omnitrophica bacterium]|nr:glycine--tRNA ligase subunit beta [Candidatus Omnitrophota bacterium]
MTYIQRNNPKSKIQNPKSADLLLEIGTEELPAAYLPGLVEQLEREAKALFDQHHLKLEKLESRGTPRRLVLSVQGLFRTQTIPQSEVRGPSKQVAFNASGKPTPALLGFLRSQKGSLKQTKVVSSDKGDYIYLIKPAATLQTAKILPELLASLITRLRSPKSMRWDESNLRFARPIRWLLAFYDKSPLPLKWGTLKAQNKTRVGHPQSTRLAVVGSILAYQTVLNKAGVLLDPRIRRERIEKTVLQLAKRCGGKVAPEMTQHGLLDEVTNLLENPYPLVGSFDRQYLELPREVLLASMAKHQRLFAVESSGRLLPRWIAVLDGPCGKPALVRQVMERILNARLSDSLYFWKQDHKQLPLSKMVQRLAGVAFHEKLGSMAEKSQRLEKLADSLIEAWQLSSEEGEALRQACRLAKADLTSTMVKEFPTLQGVMGRYYARDSGAPADVSQAIEEHYLPLNEKLPISLLGSALSILDKYDTLTSYLGVKIVPTGDQDPFGLRRAAQGIVEVAWQAHRPLPLEKLFERRRGLEPFSNLPSQETEAVGQQTQRYLLDRLYSFSWPGSAPLPVPSTDHIDAVLATHCPDLIDAMERILHLRRLTGHPALTKAAKVIERTRNILKAVPKSLPPVDPSRLAEPLEHQLWQLYQNHSSRVIELTEQRAYTEATTVFGEVFFEPLHQFFEKVLVNVPDEPLRQNRLALMRAIQTLYTDRIADLSRLTL